MIVVVSVVHPSAAWVLPPEGVERLRREFPQHTFIDARDDDARREALPRADVAFVAFLEPALIPTLTRLRWVQAPAAGIGHLLSPELLESPIILTSARGIRARAIAEHVLAVVLALARQLPQALRAQVAHEWALDRLEASGASRTLLGRRMGIVGLGSIGLEVAGLASAIGMRVSAVRRHPGRRVPAFVDRVLGPDGLHDLLAESEVVVLAAPQTARTRHFIDAAALASMPRDGWIVNLARGPLIDEDALIASLRSGQVGAAALDVFAAEPLPADHPYWDMPNVIVTPHMSGAMEDYWTPLLALFADNLRRFERGEALLNVVDKDAGY